MPHPFFFLHIPKTAGTTLNTILDDNFLPDAILNVYTDEQKERLKETTYEEIAEYDLVRGHVFIANFSDILDGPVPFNVFTFLREPVDRVISEFYFLKSWPKSHLYSFLNENDVSLHEYITSNHPMLKVRGRNLMVNSLSGVGLESVEDRLEIAWHHLKERFIFFGLLERFDESILLMNKALGIHNAFYEKQNVRNRRVHRPVSHHDLEIIQEHNSADIQLHDRACLEFEERIQAMGSALQADLRLFTKINERFQRVSDLIMQRDGAEGVGMGDLLNSK